MILFLHFSVCYKKNIFGDENLKFSYMNIVEDKFWIF